MQAVILCGGEGTRIREESVLRPKPLLEVGGYPLLWHIMKLYAHHGITDFVLCLGYKGDMIRDYFLEYDHRHRDIVVELGADGAQFLSRHGEQGWKITLVDTGRSAQTGARLRRIRHHLDGDDFCLTYGDGLADVDITELVRFHRSHERIGTTTAVRHEERFGEMAIDFNQVIAFSEKPENPDKSINGGFFVFQKRFVDEYLSDDETCILERDPLERLACDGELMAFEHKGFWECVDTFHEWQKLEQLWSAEAPWRVW